MFSENRKILEEEAARQEEKRRKEAEEVERRRQQAGEIHVSGLIMGRLLTSFLYISVSGDSMYYVIIIWFRHVLNTLLVTPPSILWSIC